MEEEQRMQGVDSVSGALALPAFGSAYGRVLASGQHDRLAMWFIDIRNFRSVNPQYGYAVGNMVLRTVADCLSSLLTRGLPVARLGGDRFVALTADLDERQAAVALDEVVAEARRRLARSGTSIPLSLAAGMYQLREQDFASRSFQAPLDYASIAHRRAHDDYLLHLVVFTEEDLQRDMRRIAIEASIDEALATEQVQVWYQPQVDYVLGEVVGAEALARWHHPELGWIEPDEFIPVLANCGKLYGLDRYVWERACRTIQRWHESADGNPVPVSVNVTREELFESDLLECLIGLCDEYSVPAGSLHLELAESVFVSDGPRLAKLLGTLRMHGIVIDMDDFGSGVSSLTTLSDVPADAVKIDMSFVRDHGDAARCGIVLESMIRMLQSLDLPIIAKGIETFTQAEMLKNMGCHLMQGFYFGHPMAPSDFDGFLASNLAVEDAERRRHGESHLDRLIGIDATSSYLFNEVIGPTMVFFASEGTSESILVNDQFYEACGLVREEFGDAKVDPIQQIAPQSRASMWRAAADARENGSAYVQAEVLLTGRWISCVMRHLDTSTRGDIYLLNIVRASATRSREEAFVQMAQDATWDLDMLSRVVPNTVLKCRMDATLSFDYASQHLFEACGLSEAEFKRRFHNQLLELVARPDRRELSEAAAASLDDGRPFSCNLSLYHGLGSDTQEVRLTGCASQATDGSAALYACIEFVGEVVSASGSVGDVASAGLVTFDYELGTDRLVLHVPQADGLAREVAIDELVGCIDGRPHLISRISADRIVSLLHDLRRHASSGFCDLKCDFLGTGELRWYHVNFSCEADEAGGAVVMHGYAQDANDQMGSAHWWRIQAQTDQLTGLLNRNAVEQSVNASMRASGGGVMFMVDLDGFKRVNDELGHLSGDELLREVAGALARCFRDDDVVGRYGGDEFVTFVAAPGVDLEALATRKAQQILDAVAETVASDGSHASCSVGVAVSHDGSMTFYDLLEVADEALYHSKEQGKGCYTIRTMARAQA